MRVIEVKLYQFDELSDEVKLKVMERMADINVDHGWWDFVYEDAATIGLKLMGFDDYKCEGKLTEAVGEVCRRILANHGKACETYRTAVDYYDRKHNGNPYIEEDFLHSLLEDYRIMLRNEYEYFTGEGAIAETIRVNEYEFTEAGRME
jgi:hypothetical protein